MKSIRCISNAAVFVFCLHHFSLGANIIVSLDGSGDYADIQAAIDAARDGDTITVRPGEYFISEPITFRGKAITVRSGRGPEDTVIRMAAKPADPDYASVVVFGDGETRESVLEGFTLTGGKGTFWDVMRGGGGVRCRNSSPTLRNCVICMNESRFGGGLYIAGYSSPLIEKCKIIGNSAEMAGGGIYINSHSAAAIITDCTISHNVARFSGGGVCCSPSPAILTNCDISNNAVIDLDGGGGGFHCHGLPSPTLVKCRIVGNLSLGSGGGVECGYQSAPHFKSCTIVGNLAKSNGGGGIACWDQVSPLFENCTILANFAKRDSGGGIASGWSSLRLVNCVIAGNVSGVAGAAFSTIRDKQFLAVNCTFFGNTVTQGADGTEAAGGTIYCEESTPGLVNCIFWKNSPPELCGQLSHCTTQENPLFVDEGVFDFSRFTVLRIADNDYEMPDFIVRAPDFHLQIGSPAIDAGTAEGAPNRDIDGTRRPCGKEVDIGAYEWCAPVKFIRGDSNQDGLVDLADAVFILQSLFASGPPILCPDAADSNDDEVINIADPVYILQSLFGNGPAIPAPYPECGVDPTPHPGGEKALPHCEYPKEICQKPSARRK